MITTRPTKLLSACAALALAAGVFSPAFAADSDSTMPPAKTKTTTTCTDGKIWDTEKKECVAPEEMKPAEQKKSQREIDNQLYEAAREFAYAGQYENALRTLRAASDQTDPRILNYLGYNNRKLGHMELGMRYYRQALQADENYILARSYMGQALLEQGDVEGARVQLVEIRDRGGESSWAYRALQQSLGGERTRY